MMPHIFQGDMVEIKNGEWSEEVSLQVSGVTQCPVRELWLCYNDRATVVKEIAHVHFTALTQLVLGGNRIESVEGLARVHMTHIKKACLGNNNITSVGVIRKAAWSDLQQLEIHGNYFADAKSLVHGFPQMKKLLVYLKWGHKNQFTEECFPAKMQATSLEYLRIRANKLCFDRCLKRILQQRWPHIKID